MTEGYDPYDAKYFANLGILLNFYNASIFDIAYIFNQQEILNYLKEIEKEKNKKSKR